MQFKNFKKFIRDIIKEGNRLLKKDVITGMDAKGTALTNLRLWSIVIAIASGSFLLRKGFPGDFVRDTTVFLGVFIALFTSIIITLYDKTKDWKDFKQQSLEWSKEDKNQFKLTKNLIIQFTGLTAYAILLALATIMLLLISLLGEDFFKSDLYSYINRLISQECASSIFSICNLEDTGSAIILFLHRSLVIYWLSIFFVVTIYSTTSYFSYIQSHFKKFKLDD
jgi:hypothetical protein